MTARARVLMEVPPLRFGEGRDCTLLACLALATGAEYEWVMGASGAAFTTAIDTATWDPLAAAPLDQATLARGAAAAGMRPDVLAPPFDGEMRALLFDRTAEAIAAKIPPLVRGIAGPPEYGLVVGYDETAGTFAVRTYFDRTDAPTRVDWSAFADAEHGLLAFLDRAVEPDRARLAHDAVTHAVAQAEAGEAALGSWLAGLRDDARWTDAKHAGTAAFGDHAMRTLLADKRRAAARFLRANRARFSNRAAPELLRAAEAYDHVVEACEKIGVGRFDAAVAARFLDAGRRRAWAKQLEAIAVHESEAREGLSMALR